MTDLCVCEVVQIQHVSKSAFDFRETFDLVFGWALLNRIGAQIRE